MHVLGAAVWSGGHLVLALVIMPRAKRVGDARVMKELEASFEPLAVPARLAQVQG